MKMLKKNNYKFYLLGLCWAPSLRVEDEKNIFLHLN